MTLIEMSLSSIVIIVMIIIVRTLLLHKLPKRLFVFLWGIVLCRLLLPFTFHIRIPPFLYNFFRDGVSTDQTIGTSTANIPELSNKLQTALQATETSAVNWLFPIWCLGVAALALVFLVPHIRFVLANKSAVPVKNDKILDWIGNYHFKRQIQVKQAQGIITPVTYGVINPIILLPKSLKEYKEEQLKLMIVHELTHIKHFDVLWKWLLLLAVSIHWFNPFVWITYILANRDIELSCDETVIRSLSKEISKSSYAMALIGLEEHKLKFVPIGNSFSENAIEERIIAIMQTKKFTFISLALTVMITVGTIILFAATSAKAVTPAEIEVSKETESNNPDYSVNEQGETYSDAPYGTGTMQELDLVEAVGTNGVQGYVKSTDLEPTFSSPEEAIAFQEANKDGRSVPLYESDGKTVIGEFIVKGSSSQE